MKKIITLAASFLFFIGAQSQGVRFDKEKYAQVEQWEMDELGFSGTLPTKYSMRKHCPPIQNQGDEGTCVGWATAYGAMSIIFNLKFETANNSSKKYLYSFDPYFIYSLIKYEGDYNCEEGTFPEDAMEILKNYGCKRILIPQVTSCQTVINDTSIAYGYPFRIKEYYAPPPSYNTDTDEGKINILKNVLADNNPLVIGAQTTRSLYNKENGLWDSFSDEENEGGHAMCLIGYDDNKFGGAFEVMNSWGDEFGDNGFIWVKYNDFIRVVDEIYMIKPYDIKPFKKEENNCILGDCFNSYSHIEYTDGTYYEGDFKDGERNGYGLIHYYHGGQYAGYWKNGRKEGMHYYYNPKKDSWNKRFYKRGKLDSELSLGFGEVKNEKEIEMDNLFNNFKTSGIIKLGENEDPDDIEQQDNDL